MKRTHFVAPDVPTAPDVVASAAAVRPTRVFRILGGVSARRLRGLSLLASLSLVLVVSVLAVVSVLPRWSIPAAGVALLVDVALLRRVAVAQRVARRSIGQTRESASGSSDRAARQPTYFDEEPEPAESEPEEAGAGEITKPIESPAPVDPAGWAPVPVPPPTYTLKAKAPDPVVVPAAVTEPEAIDSWSLDGMVYDCDLDELVERRRATGA